MNKKIKKLVRKAGFCMWSDETWRPEGAVVDWAADYDKELELFAMMIVAKGIKKIEKNIMQMEKTMFVDGTNDYMSGQVLGLLYAKEYLENMFDFTE
jgi:hypothetical protein